MTVSIQRENLHQAIDSLPDNTLLDLAKFIEFLQFKMHNDGSMREEWVWAKDDDMPEAESLSPRVLGLHQGEGWMVRLH